MKYNFILLFIALIIGSGSSKAVDLLGSGSAKYKKVVDVQVGTLDNEYCTRDCPKYPGGEEALMKYIYAQLGLTSNSSSNQNPTVVKFLITNTGKVKDVSIEKTSNEQYDREILKVISSLPNFIPLKDGACYYGWINIYLPKE